MYRLKLIIILFFIFFQRPDVNAQNKYAIIIGINEYYKTKTQLSEYSLKGCVNDALAIKTLLKNRFGFEEKNINTILNQTATQENLIKAFNEIITKSKAGDAVVFYFSGHGTFINNNALDNDPIKKGYNQSLVMSDLYTNDYSCLVRDNTLKKFFNQFVAKKVILTTIFDCCFSGGMSMTNSIAIRNHNPYSINIENNDFGISVDTSRKKSFPIEGIDTSSRAFDLEKTLVRRDTEIVPRPAETPNSRFASLSASENYVRAAEIWDESGVPHGAFTKALLSLYENTNDDILLSKVIEQINKQINEIQLLVQRPQFAIDPMRNRSNLIGLPLQSKPIQAISANCINLSGKVITLDKGYHTGLAIGNIFTHQKGKIVITRVFAESANAEALGSNTFKNGDIFTLTDRYRTSNPLLKVYIYSTNLNAVSFMKSFNAEVLPLTKNTAYQHYYNWYDDPFTPSFLFTLKPGEGKQFLSRANKKDFTVFLPIPSDLAFKIKSSLEKEQSIKIVSNINEADHVLYLNYAPATEPSQQPKFVFNYRKALGFEGFDKYKFSKFATAMTTLILDEDEKKELAKKINKISFDLARTKGTHWFNPYPKR